MEGKNKKTGRFEKGHKLSMEHLENIKKANRNRIFSKETRLKLSIANKGKKHSDETKEKLSIAHKGKKASDETKLRMSIAHKGKKNPKLSAKMKGKPTWNKGIKWDFRNFRHSETTKKRMSKIKKKFYAEGNKPWSYIDGRSKSVGPARYGDDWSKIRLLIYERDNYTCQKCGLTMGESKRPHHIHHKVLFLESFDNSPDNLITLCPSCHRKEDAVLIKEFKKRGNSP